jgi:hypothetical protein
MICPKCKELSLKSSISVGASYTTAMYCPPYYDEQGVFHSHDMNTNTTHYSCSNGHHFYISNIGRCLGCDFGKDNERITVLEDVTSSKTITFDSDGNLIFK